MKIRKFVLLTAAMFIAAALCFCCDEANAAAKYTMKLGQ